MLFIICLVHFIQCREEFWQSFVYYWEKLHHFVTTKLFLLLHCALQLWMAPQLILDSPSFTFHTRYSSRGVTKVFKIFGSRLNFEIFLKCVLKSCLPLSTQNFLGVSFALKKDVSKGACYILTPLVLWRSDSPIFPKHIEDQKEFASWQIEPPNLTNTDRLYFFSPKPPSNTFMEFID